MVAVNPIVLELAADVRDLGGGADTRADAVAGLEVAAHPNPVGVVDGARLQGAAGTDWELLRCAGPRGRRSAVADGRAGDVHGLVAAARVEGEVADGGRGGDIDRDQAAGIREGAHADAGDRGGDRDRHQAAACAEGVLADASDRGWDLTETRLVQCWKVP